MIKAFLRLKHDVINDSYPKKQTNKEKTSWHFLRLMLGVSDIRTESHALCTLHIKVVALS